MQVGSSFDCHDVQSITVEMKSETDTLLKSYGDLKLMDTDSVRLVMAGDWCLFIMREK